MNTYELKIEKYEHFATLSFDIKPYSDALIEEIKTVTPDVIIKQSDDGKTIRMTTIINLNKKEFEIIIRNNCPSLFDRIEILSFQ